MGDPKAELLRDLEHDLVKGESQSVEFKEEFPENANDLAKEIASFATTNAGRVYIGIDDDGNIVGLKEISDMTYAKAKDDYQRRIQGVTQGIDPPVRVSVEFIEKDARIVARIDVPKGSEPTYYVNGRPYVRDLSVSRLARAAEVKELHSRYLGVMRPPRRADEIGSYATALLDLTSDIELILATYRDHLINPDLNQMLYDIHTHSELLSGMSKVKPAEQLNIREHLVTISESLDSLASHTFTLGTRSIDEFGNKAKGCLDLLSKLRDLIRPHVKPSPIPAYVNILSHNIVSLQNDWNSRQRRFKIGDIELLKEAFRIHAFTMYRLSFRPEALELSVGDDLAELGRNLRELASTEKYFGYWWGNIMLQRLEGKFAQCEAIISRIVQKIR